MLIVDLNKNDLFSFKHTSVFLFCKQCNSTVNIFTGKIVNDEYYINCYFCHHLTTLAYPWHPIEIIKTISI